MSITTVYVASLRSWVVAMDYRTSKVVMFVEIQEKNEGKLSEYVLVCKHSFLLSYIMNWSARVYL